MVFVSNPAAPVPTRGGAMLGGSGTVAQTDVENRADVLVYSTPPLAEDTEVTGPVSAVLYVSTSASSGDFTAKLVDVHEDGAAYNVSDGIVRQIVSGGGLAGRRGAGENHDRALADQHAVSTRTSHSTRDRRQVSASPRSRYGPAVTTARRGVLATQVVHHGPHTPSRIVLPIVATTR